MPSQALASHFQTLARYNQIANRRVYEVCMTLDDADYRKQRFGSFGSIHRTLNHILVGDRIWMARFERTNSGISRLDQILCEELEPLWQARQAEDDRIVHFADALGAEFLAETIRYTNNLGDPNEDPSPLAIAHMFNHQTHHRAHVQAMLGELGKPPNLDLHRAIRTRAGASST